MKKRSKKPIIVIIFLIAVILYLFVKIRGDYLQMLGICQEYIDVFVQNLKYKTSVIIINFVFLYLITYITTKFIKKGLKKFFDSDKKEMPKLPNKSISLILGVIVSIVTSNMISEKVIVALNSTFFGTSDPIFNFDIAFYMFQKPFIELLLTYFIGVMVRIIHIYHRVLHNSF
jgi:uncharacterized membrane protein (UPF0182 family)